MERIIERRAPASSATTRKPDGQKRKGKHPEKALTPVFVRNVKTPGWYADGNCLYLVVDDNGSKRWTLSLSIKSAARRRQMGLGSVSLVPLGEARELAVAYRKLARAGIDPIAQRQQQTAGSLTFAQVATEVHEGHKGGWKNAKHRAQWLTTLTTYAFPAIGARHIGQIDSADILKVLLPIWLEKPETARRVKQRLKAVIDYAKAAGYRTGDNPVGDIGRALPAQSQRPKHHAALPYDQVPQFVRGLRDFDTAEAVKLAFEFCILTAARTGEVLQARWAQIDFNTAIWTVPAVAMKSGRPHEVPLSPRALEILLAAKKLADDGGVVFPSRTLGKPLSSMCFLMVLRRMKAPFTAHGFRSSFRDWCGDKTSFPREVAEAALAHVVSDKVEASYRRGTALDKRRELMATWSQFICSTPGEIVTLRA